MNLHICIHPNELKHYTHTHLYSEMDELDPASCLPLGKIRGYTEWASNRRPCALSFSWDWDYDCRRLSIDARWETLRTNVRMVDHEGTHLNDWDTRRFIAHLMTELQWEHTISSVLGLTLMPSVTVTR
ncbi:DUF4902 domain-containing protein [Burkholderiaceae bacterium DAT-1]|nr:DUF4902 domain-containing protein [Burkholderiaceae bacterium DAT-1]